MANVDCTACNLGTGEHSCGYAQPERLRPWWHDCTEIARLLEWLYNRGEMKGNYCSLPRFIALVAKPWNWTKEYEQMCKEQAK